MGEKLQYDLVHPCIICGQPKQQGIMILSEFICEECETEMVKTDVSDLRYMYFIRQMKQIVYKQNA